MPASDQISEKDYRRLCDWVRTECGVQLHPSKQTMIRARLGRRARALGLGSLNDYFDYLRTTEGGARETPHLVDAVTTHKTDFFREPAHFDLLRHRMAPELEQREGAGIQRPLAVWCAASSTGEEPYTLAMVLNDYAQQTPRGYRFSIEATDISVPVLETAAAGIYPESAVLPVPAEMRKRYLLRGRDPERPRVRIVPGLRASVRFRQLNLIDSDYGFAQPLDIVFCRNVMIYFDRPTQARVLDRICRNIRPGGFLVMGHSESLTGMELPVTQVNPTVYRRNHG